MEPKFRVGELVILQSKDCPEFNGEYIVHNVLNKGGSLVCRLTGRSCYASGKISYFSYLLDTPCLNSSLGVETAWAESALRKKHLPSSESFDKLMSSLKQPQRA